MSQKPKKIKQKREFSKWLLIQESILIWVISLAFLGLAFFCVINQFFGELPWLAAMCGFPWTAYGASQAFYYKKTEKENTKNGLKYEATLQELNKELNNDNSNIDDNSPKG